LQADSITIDIRNAGKKFGREWIFRHVNLNIAQGDKLVILGLNGSGKSTLLQAFTGFLGLNEGEVQYSPNGKSQKIDDDKAHRYLSLASPYLELIEDFTLPEIIDHLSVYKPFMKGLTRDQIMELSGLAAHRHKFIRLYSSGMKQRLKLTLAILADAPVLFLDEPTTNLDASVIDWYAQMIATYAMHKTIVVASNSIEEEYAFCTRELQMSQFKYQKP